MKCFRLIYNKTPSEIDPDYLDFVERWRILTKIFLKDEPIMSPGKCSNCGASGRDRKYVDFGLTIEWYGVVYICSKCIEELFRLFNYAPVAADMKFKVVEKHIEILRDSNKKLIEYNTEFLERVENLAREVAHVRNSMDSARSSYSPDEVVAATSEKFGTAGNDKSPADKSERVAK